MREVWNISLVWTWAPAARKRCSSTGGERCRQRHGGVPPVPGAKRLGGAGPPGLVERRLSDAAGSDGPKRGRPPRREGPGHLRADARPGDAGQGGEGAAPVHHLVRPAHGQAVRGDHPAGGEGAADPDHRQPGPDRLYRLQDPVGAGERATALRPVRPHPAAQGLCAV